jgi:homoserine kinase
MRLTARVPATAANLGPGFDSFGLALDLWNEVTVDTDADPGVTWDGEGANELPTDGTDMVSRAMARVERLATETHGAGFMLPPLRVHGVNRIPLERGLGSSAAAAAAGIALAYRVLDPIDGPDPSTTFSVAAELEGHPDNAAAAIYGGFTIVADGFVHRLAPDDRVRPVVLVPSLTLATGAARRALPETVPSSDAVFNVGHAALVVAALTSDPDLLQVALHDRLHEDVRLGFVPEARALVDELRHRNVPVCVSGAGPTLLAFEREESGAIPDPGPGWRVMRLGVATTGLELVEG